MTASKIIGWLTKNFGWRLLSLAIAYVIWTNVASEPELATLVSAPVQYRDAGNDLEIASDLLDRVELETRGPSGLLRALTGARPVVVLDFSDVKDPGERTFTVTRSQTNLPQGVELLRATPAQIRLKFERRARKTVPVKVRFTGTLPDGRKTPRAVAEPGAKEIYGPASQVALIASVETDAIDLGSIDPANAEVRVATFIPQPRVRFSESPEVTVKITLR
jgi:YbbR domain-containing protein